MLVDPRRIKNVPGRKTDVLDCQWLQQLHTYGLLSGAFRPDGEIRRLRSYLRQRVMLVQYASHHIQHAEGADPDEREAPPRRDGKTGTDIIEAIVSGQRDNSRPQDQGRRGNHRQVSTRPLAARSTSSS